MERELANIVDLFYDHDFDKAEAAARAIESRHPGHPAGPLFLAVSLYQRWVADGLRGKGWEPVEAQLDRALRLGRELERSAPAEAHYFQGAALGFRARGMGARRKYFRAVPDAAASLKHLKKALALDPALTDARLGLGMYHYYAARMPAAARPFAGLLLGEKGDRAKGLAELWEVARSSGAARMEARAVLSMILVKDDEADWEQAEALLGELMTRYPRNPVYRLRRAYAAQRRGDLERALKLADPDGAWIKALHPGVRKSARTQALFRAADAHYFAGRPEEARGLLSRLEEPLLPPALRPWLKIRREELAAGKPRPAAPAPFYSGY